MHFSLWSWSSSCFSGPSPVIVRSPTFPLTTMTLMQRSSMFVTHAPTESANTEPLDAAFFVGTCHEIVVHNGKAWHPNHCANAAKVEFHQHQHTDGLGTCCASCPLFMSDCKPPKCLFRKRNQTPSHSEVTMQSVVPQLLCQCSKSGVLPVPAHQWLGCPLHNTLIGMRAIFIGFSTKQLLAPMNADGLS